MTAVHAQTKIDTDILFHKVMAEVSACQEAAARVLAALVLEEIGAFAEIVAHMGQQIATLTDTTGEVGQRMSEIE